VLVQVGGDEDAVVGVVDHPVRSTRESLPPPSRMPLPKVAHSSGTPGASRLWFASTRLPTMSTWRNGGSSSESRVLGTIPAQLRRQTERTIWRLPPALVPE
jgi:hypothetical protein